MAPGPMEGEGGSRYQVTVEELCGETPAKQSSGLPLGGDETPTLPSAAVSLGD